MKENQLPADDKAKLARKVYTHLIQLTKPPHQAFADLHERQRQHAEHQAKHPPKPKPEATKEEIKEENQTEKTRQ